MRKILKSAELKNKGAVSSKIYGSLRICNDEFDNRWNDEIYGKCEDTGMDYLLTSNFTLYFENAEQRLHDEGSGFIWYQTMNRRKV